jgi:hypothetical protein
MSITRACSVTCSRAREGGVGYRALEIDGPNEPGLDARRVVLGELVPGNDEPQPPRHEPAAVLWQGDVPGGSKPQRSYFVAIYADGSGRCACPDFYFRAVLRDARDYSCKHIRRARAQLER